MSRYKLHSGTTIFIITKKKGEFYQERRKEILRVLLKYRDIDLVLKKKKKIQIGDASFFISERHFASDDTEYTSCSVQSCLFVQCWLGIFLAQCSGNLFNVGAAFAPTGYY